MKKFTYNVDSAPGENLPKAGISATLWECGNTLQKEGIDILRHNGPKPAKREIQTPIGTGMDQDCLKSSISVSLHMKRSSFHVSFGFYSAD